MLHNFTEGMSLRLEKRSNFYVWVVAHCKAYLSLVLWTTPKPKVFQKLTVELNLRNTLHLNNKL